MTPTTDILPHLEVVRDTVDIQQLGLVFDQLVAVGHGYDGHLRNERILDATVDDMGSRLVVFPYYQRADIHYLRADCYDARSGQTQTYTLRGNYRDQGKSTTIGHWQFVDRPLSNTIVVPSEQAAQQFFSPVITAWNELNAEQQLAYLKDTVNRDNQRSKSQSFLARLLGHSTR